MYSQSIATGINPQTKLPDGGNICRDSSGAFAQGLCFYKLVWVFTLCSMLGVVAEVVFCFIFKGYFESRQGMLYGPFNQIYGFGAVLLLLALHRVERKRTAFLLSAAIGGVFEITCSLIQEYVFGSVSWDYRWMPFAIGNGRTNILYIIFFGILGTAFISYLYPFISGIIERIDLRRGVIMSWVIVVFMTFNLCLSAAAVSRWAERQTGTPPMSGIDRFIDTYYPDETLSEIYPSMMIAK